MINSRAIVFLFRGDEPTPELLAEVGRILGKFCHVEGNIDAKVFSAEDLSKILVANVRCVTIRERTQAKHPTPEKTPEEEAMIYLGTTMSTAFEAPFNEYNLMMALTLQIEKTRSMKDLEPHKRLMNALFTLSQENLVISKSLMEKYHFSVKKIATIKKVYNFVTSY